MTKNEAVGLRYLGLLITVGFCGLLSGFFHPMVMGIRGAILGIALALGVIMANRICSNRLGNGIPHKWIVVLLAAVTSGFLGGLLVALYGTGGLSTSQDFPPDPTTSIAQTLIVGLMYALLLHFVYALRWRMRRGWLFVLVPLVGLTGGVFKALLTVERYDPAELLLIGLFSGVPFAVLWIAAVVIWDPAWSFERWKKCWPGKVVEGQACLLER